MSTKPTREFKTTGGHVLVLNEYITGAENWEMKQVYISGMKDGQTVDAGATAQAAERKAFELVVVSIDGVTEKIADVILALPVSEYSEIANEVRPIVEGKKK